MNRREYDKAMRDTRKALYRGDVPGLVGGVLRALVAHNDPDDQALPAARQLKPAPAIKLIRPKKKRGAGGGAA